MPRRIHLLILLASSLGACVTLEEASMSKGAVQSGQRLIVLVYPSPGPLLSEQDSKVESAAKVVPGIGLVVQSAQNERDLEASKDLQRYLPAWKPAELFFPLIMRELQGIGQPGKLTTAEEAEIAPDMLAKFNQASDLLDWCSRYYWNTPGASGLSRNYSKLLSLDDALILEVNLAYGASTDGEGNAVPTLSAVTRLLKANTMRLLWRHEDMVEDRAGMRTLYDFKVDGRDLVTKYERLMPQLGSKIALNFRQALEQSGVAIANNPPSPPMAAAAYDPSQAMPQAQSPAQAPAASTAAPSVPPMWTPPLAKP
ncbi:MAG: hypothetical protein HY549_11830 [Elusimicrobia bacterium]|nr:hypothetical protein [Elusimicrobiota bacterium]